MHGAGNLPASCITIQKILMRYSEVFIIIIKRG